MLNLRHNCRNVWSSWWPAGRTSSSQVSLTHYGHAETVIYCSLPSLNAVLTTKTFCLQETPALVNHSC